MRKVFLNRWLLAFIGAALLCALIWFGGPLIGIGGSHPLDSEIVRAVVMAAIVVLIVVLLLIGSLRSRKKDEKLIEGVAGGPPPKDDRTQAIDAQRLTQRNKLTEALGDLRKVRGGAGGGYLYEFPWYVIIGPPGAGKTTALLNSGQRFPLAERHGAQEIKGEGGTRNCDWYFTEKAVIIDTAGRYTTQDSDQSIDQAGWRNFLGLLKDTRPSQPLNGVFVVFDVAYLVGRSRDERRADARAVRSRLIELQEAFGLRLPIYVVFTKLDRIAGFTEFFDDLSREDREQVLGITFPYEQKGPASHKGFTDAFDRLLTRLKTRLLDRLQAERDLARRNLIFGFPAQFASLRSIIDEMLTEAADESRFAEPLLIRGVYFSSATQQGLPIDRLMGVLASKFGVSQTALPAQVGAGRGFFLQRLFETVVYGEAGLVGANAGVARRRRLIRRVSFAAIAAATLLLSGLWIWSYLDNRALVDRVASRILQLEPAMAAASTMPLGDGDPRPVLQLLNDIRALPTGFADQAAGRSAAIGFGLYQGDRLAVHTAGLYRRALYSLLLPRMIMRAQTRLNTRLGDPERAYDAIKAYLMLGNPAQLDNAYINAWTAADWSSLPEPDRVALAGHLEALLAEPWETIALDEPLIAEARERIARLTPAQRAFNALANTPGMPPWRVIDATGIGGNAEQVMRRPSGRPLTDGVPGYYTARCYHAFVLQRLPQVLPLASRDAWVFGEAQQQLSQPQTLQAEVLNLYMQAYIQQWETLLNDLAFVPLNDAQQASNVLLILSGPNSPFLRLMRAIAREVRLTQPPQAQTVQGGQGVLQTAAAVATATGAAGVCAGTVTVAGQAAAAIASGLTQMAGGTVNPAQVVEDRFRWLIDFVGAEGQSSFLNDYVQRLGTLATQASALVSGGGAGASTGTSFAALATQISNEAVRLPQQVARLVRTLAAQSAERGYEQARIDIARIWANDVLPFCMRATQSRFPFTRGATPEIPLDDFGRLFGPGQMIDTFFQNNLKDHINTAQRPWRLTTTALAIPQPTIDHFMRAADIRDAFFPAGSPAPGVMFNVAPLSAGDARQTVLEIEGQVLTMDAANMPAMLMQWPRTGGMRLAADGADALKIDGQWAFLRMFDRAGPSRRSDDRWDIGLPGGVRVQLQARSLRNPFSLRASAADFRCVPL